MAALRWGMLCFGVGLFVASVAAVGVGLTLGCTDVGCPGAAPSFSLVGVSATGVAVSDGCNTCQLNPGVVGGVALSALGVVVGGIGVVGDLRAAE